MNAPRHAVIEKLPGLPAGRVALGEEAQGLLE